MKWFFSYARADAREVEPGKAEVDAFFRDLSHHVERLVPGAEGFLDVRDVDLGDLWEPTILRHLGEASVMVCLLSPSYIASPYCSREWAYFSRRAADAASRIVPVLWVKVKEPPPCVAAAQFDNERMPDSYRKHGMWHLTELRSGSQRDAYVEARSSLAQVIAEKGALPALPTSPAPVPRFDQLEDLFRQKPPLLTLSSEMVDLGVVEAGASATVTIRNGGGGMLTWSHPEAAGNFQLDAPDGRTVRVTVSRFASDPEYADAKITSNGGEATLRLVARPRGGIPELIRLDSRSVDVTDGPQTVAVLGIQPNTDWSVESPPPNLAITRLAASSVLPNGGLKIERVGAAAVDAELRIATRQQWVPLRVTARPRASLSVSPARIDATAGSHVVRVHGVAPGRSWGVRGDDTGFDVERLMPAADLPCGGLRVTRRATTQTHRELEIVSGNEVAKLVLSAAGSALPAAAASRDRLAGTWTGPSTLTITKLSTTSYTLVETNLFGAVSFQGQTNLTPQEAAAIAAMHEVNVLWIGMGLFATGTIATYFVGDLLMIPGVGTWQRG